MNVLCGGWRGLSRRGSQGNRTAPTLKTQSGRSFKKASCKSVIEPIEMAAVNEGYRICPWEDMDELEKSMFSREIRAKIRLQRAKVEARLHALYNSQGLWSQILLCDLRYTTYLPSLCFTMLICTVSKMTIAPPHP